MDMDIDASEQPSVIDSHVSLYPASEMHSLGWRKPGSPLDAQHSVDEYRAAISLQETPVRGFILVEAGRTTPADESDEAGWEQPLAEVAWMARVANGTPRAGEGHAPADAALVAAMVPWAPLAAGPAALARYVARALRLAGPAADRIPAFRHVLRDDGAGVASDAFADSVRWLGREGYALELGLDAADGGSDPLEGAIRVLRRVNLSTPAAQRPRVVVGHMCRPTMGRETAASFADWKRRVFALAAMENVAVKLAGGLAQMEPLRPHGAGEPWTAEFVDEVATLHGRYIRSVISVFGPERCLFASDWPVCNVGGGDNETAWPFWHETVRRRIDVFEEADRQKMWSGNAVRIYKIR